MLLFFAFGLTDVDAICDRIRRTARWADTPTLRRLLYATSQHTAAVRSRDEALAVLTRCIARPPAAPTTTPGTSVGSTITTAAVARNNALMAGGVSATEDLLARPAPPPRMMGARRHANANVLPHLTGVERKTEFLAYLIGVLLNHLFDPSAHASQQFDKDHVGNKRFDVCGVLLAQQIRNSL